VPSVVRMAVVKYLSNPVSEAKNDNNFRAVHTGREFIKGPL